MQGEGCIQIFVFGKGISALVLLRDFFSEASPTTAAAACTFRRQCRRGPTYKENHTMKVKFLSLSWKYQMTVCRLGLGTFGHTTTTTTTDDSLSSSAETKCNQMQEAKALLFWPVELVVQKHTRPPQHRANTSTSAILLIHEKHFSSDEARKKTPPRRPDATCKLNSEV